MSSSRHILLTRGVSGFVVTGVNAHLERAAVPAPPPAPAAPEPPPAPPPPDLDAIRREAFARGEAKAREEAQAERRKLVALWQDFELAYESYQRNVRAEIAEQVIDAAVQLAEIIVRHQMPDAERLAKSLRETVEPVIHAPGLRVHLHPADAALLDSDPAGAGGPIDPAKVDIVRDPALSPGDVVVESAHGWFDARVAERLDMARETLKKRYRNADAD
ncbi:MAG: hypothetical protein JXR37_07725 [Kiritimatiellae bacterium]|nr:hypothetical protein [Kiritimatiellia bacterium]